LHSLKTLALALVTSLLATVPALAQSQPAPVTAAQAREFNALVDEAHRLVEPFILIHNRPTLALDEARVRRGLALFDQALTIYNGNWATWMMKGKAHQALGETRAAFESFRRAYELAPSEPMTANEMTIEAMRLGELDFAFQATTAALRRAPDSLELRCRLALLLILQGRLDEGRAEAQRALEIAPGDEIALNLIEIADDIRAGRRSQPSTLAELEAG